MRRERKEKRERRREERKKRIKKSFTRWTITVYIYTITIYLQDYCAYLEIFKKTDVGGGGVKMCKIEHFLYFRRLYMSWCDCLCCLWVLTCNYAFGEYWSLDISNIFTIWIVFYQIEKNKKSLHYSCKDSKSPSFYWHVITCLNDSLLDNTRILKALFSTEIIEKKKKKKN